MRRIKKMPHKAGPCGSTLRGDGVGTDDNLVGSDRPPPISESKSIEPGYHHSGYDNLGLKNIADSGFESHPLRLMKQSGAIRKSRRGRMLPTTKTKEKNCKNSENLVDKKREGGVWGYFLRDFAASNAITASPKQIRDNLRNVQRFLQFSKISPCDITTEPIEKFLAFIQAQGRSRKTIVNVRGSISRFCRYLKSRKLIAENPCKEILLAKPDESVPITLSETDVKKAIAIARKHGICAEVCCAAYAGLRLSEICRMAWADVDFDNRVLTVKKAKSKKPRVIPMARLLFIALAKQHKTTGSTQWVFPARQTFPGGFKWINRPTSPCALARRLAPIQKAFAEFNPPDSRRVGRGWHLFRHTFATRLVNSNTSIYKVSGWLGHSDVRMTQRYAHLKKEYDTEIENGL